MKKGFIIMVSVLVLILFSCAGLLWYAQANPPGRDKVPVVTVTLFGQELSPSAYDWNLPQLAGLIYHNVAFAAEQSHHDLGEVQDTSQPPVLPEGYSTTISLSRDGEELYSGAASGWQPELLQQSGSYSLQIYCIKEEVDGKDYGSMIFNATFVIPAPEPEPEENEDPSRPSEPQFTPGRQQLQQGDIFTMQVLYLPEDITPSATTGLGLSVFMPLGDGGWLATIPVGNGRSPGDYAVQVTAGDWSWDVTVTVSEFDFDRQNLIIDHDDPNISEANSPEAYQQYREKIPPLFYTYDEERYWEGLFIQPAQGWISTNFGEIRITNGDPSTSRSHNGMDIAAAEGSPVIAPNNGRVVLAEYLLNTGWTIVIEHGGGLKTYYFHMSEIEVEVNDMVATGEPIGKVGTTGYSTGAHLHFEVRIGDQPVSPQMMFEGDAGLYSLWPDMGEEDTAA